MQSDQMFQKYLPKIDATYANIPHHFRAIMGNTSTYQVQFDPLFHPRRPPPMRLESKSRRTKSYDNHKNIASDLSSDEGEEEKDFDEQVESGTDSDDSDVPNPGDKIDVADSEGTTFTDWIMLAWKASCTDLLAFFACASFLFIA